MRLAFAQRSVQRTPHSVYQLLSALCFYYTAQDGGVQTVTDLYGWASRALGRPFCHYRLYAWSMLC